jgi:hypothetical protein
MVPLFLGIGALVGFGGGLFAIGGALIAIPVLTAAFAFSQHEAQGTAMLMALASATVTLVLYARRGLLLFADGWRMAVSSTIVGLASSQLVRLIPDASLQRGFGAFLILLALIVWFVHLGQTDNPRHLRPYEQVAIGALAGALSGLFVVGGALVAVPLLERVARYSQQRAQAMVLLMLVHCLRYWLNLIRAERLCALASRRRACHRCGRACAPRDTGGSHVTTTPLAPHVRRRPSRSGGAAVCWPLMARRLIVVTLDGGIAVLRR